MPSSEGLATDFTGFCCEAGILASWLVGCGWGTSPPCVFRGFCPWPREIGGTMKSILKFNIIFTTNFCCWHLPLRTRHWFMTEQALHREREKKKNLLGVSQLISVYKNGWFPKALQKMAGRSRSKKVNVFISVSFSTEEFKILALGHMEWIFQKEIIYSSLFLLKCFSLCQVDPLKQPSTYLRFWLE